MLSQNRDQMKLPWLRFTHNTWVQLSFLLLLGLCFSALIMAPALLQAEQESDTQIVSDASTTEQAANGTLNSAATGGQDSFFSQNTLAELQIFIENFSLRSYWRLAILKINSGRLFHDLGQTLQSLATVSGTTTFSSLLFSLVQVSLGALFVEFLVRFTLLRPYLKRTDACPLLFSHRLRLALLYAVPEILSLFIFTLAFYAAYVFIYASHFSDICPTFLMALVTIVFIRVAAILSRFILAPSNGSIRLAGGTDQTARLTYRSSIVFVSIITIGVLLTSLLKYGGLDGDSMLLVKLFFGTLFLMAAGLVLVLNRATISSWIRRQQQQADTQSHPADRGFQAWLIFAIIYLVLLWLIWSSKLILSESQLTVAFALSILIIPIFLLLDGLIGWLFFFARKALSSEDLTGEEEVHEGHRDEPPSGTISSYLRLLSRLVLLALLFIWVLHLYNIRFAYTDTLVAGIQKVILIFIVFFIIWQIVDKSINSYLLREQETEQEDDEGEESEWGGGRLLNRSQTLLPIVRKFMGIVMLVMLSLFTLSAIGVNIGPLLAGAGVMGIAIGFGAQKLVSDLLSGFFFLVDDAFRVGEYIEAEPIKGTVEKITLRNLMLRHHRGMLQIIPYSSLGSITNYMRGGIVVKFNLQFPYDTDVDLVRKVIKRVGIEMLDDPELGNNFIKQLKSQGIREVGDSVLTIRAKFTAKPGTHFLIRREAYRRITEALAGKGIHYAHRKVIVDFPESAATEAPLEEDKKKALQAGAASALAAEANQQQESGSQKLP
jgi:small-conductance mechanosensitive channel